jgi:hypothetical protein
VFLVLTAAATVPLIFVRFPSRTDGLRRLEGLLSGEQFQAPRKGDRKHA